MCIHIYLCVSRENKKTTVSSRASVEAKEETILTHLLGEIGALRVGVPKPANRRGMESFGCSRKLLASTRTGPSRAATSADAAAGTTAVRSLPAFAGSDPALFSEPRSNVYADAAAAGAGARRAPAKLCGGKEKTGTGTWRINPNSVS